MYRVQLHEFEGPLDLLLFFIRRDELDIYDIPIARITDEFLAYVRVMGEIDLDGVGDFIFMAAQLIGIKVRMLLPRAEVDEEGEPIDPRRELVERLLEYVRYKEAAAALHGYHEARADHYTRGQASALQDTFRDDEPEVLVNTTLFDLVGALRRVLTMPSEEPVHEVDSFEFTVTDQVAYVLEHVPPGHRVTFIALARHWHKGFIISTFLAILELSRQGIVRLAPTKAADDFYVERIAEAGSEGGAATQPEREV